VVAWSGAGEAWQVEIYNPTAEDLYVGGWWLGVAPTYDAFVIPNGMIVAAGGYETLGQSGEVVLPPFEGSGAIWLLEPGFVARIHDQVSHSAWGDGEAWGRWPDWGGPMVPMTAPTLGGPNADPRIGPLVISELMVQAVDIPESVDLNDLEYVELHNPSQWPEALGGWRLLGGVELTFADATWIEPGGTLLVLSWDPAAPENAALIETFREHYGLTDATPLTGGYDGSLSDQGEGLSLWRPTDSGATGLEDSVAYGDAALEAGTAPGPGEGLHRQGLQSLGLDASSWLAGPPTPGVVMAW
jgi:hypothetical protein